MVLIVSVPGHCLSFTFYTRVLMVVLCGGPKSLHAILLMPLFFQYSGIVCNQFAFFRVHLILY